MCELCEVPQCTPQYIIRVTTQYSSPKEFWGIIEKALWGRQQMFTFCALYHHFYDSFLLPQWNSQGQQFKVTLLMCFSQQGSRKRRVKLVFDREYETSSTGEESAPETQRGRLSSTHNSQVNVNGSIYVAQNGSIIRTRRSVNTTGPTQTTTTNNNLKLPSPIFSSRLAKHFKKLDKMATTLEERVPLNSFRTTLDGGCNTLRTFQSSGTVATTTTTSSFSNPDSKTLNVFNTRQSSVSSGSTSTSNAGPESVASKSNLLKVAQEGTEQSQSTAERNESEEGERESKVDGSNDDTDGLVIREPLECPSDRTQSDEEELWMGPWNSLHIPMTKLWLNATPLCSSHIAKITETLRHDFCSLVVELTGMLQVNWKKSNYMIC